MANQDNSGMGVVIGILLAVVVGFGVYYYMDHKSGPDMTIEGPGMKIEASVPNE